MRAIVWTVVAILVAAALVFFITMQRERARIRARGLPTTEEVKQEARHFLHRADGLAADVNRLRTALTGKLNTTIKSRLTQADSLVSEIRSRAQRLAAETGEAALKTRHELNELLKRFQHLKRQLEKEKR